MASWLSLSKNFICLLASKPSHSLVPPYLLCEIAIIDASNITGIGTSIDTDTDIVPSSLIIHAFVYYRHCFMYTNFDYIMFAVYHMIAYGLKYSLCY